MDRPGGVYGGVVGRTDLSRSYDCFLNPFIAAFTKPININTPLAIANSHLTMVNIAVTHANGAGVDGYTVSIATIPKFSNKSNNQPPKGVTLNFCITLCVANPR